MLTIINFTSSPEYTNLNRHYHLVAITIITITQSFPQNLNLLLNLHPKHQLIQLRILPRSINIHNLNPIIHRINREHIHRRNHPFWLVIPGNRKQSRHKSLLYIGEAKLVSDSGNGVA